ASGAIGLPLDAGLEVLPHLSSHSTEARPLSRSVLAGPNLEERMRRLVASSAVVWGIAGSLLASSTAPHPILFVTQVPFGNDFATVNSVFGNHLGNTGSGPRGGDLWIRYPDGSLRNLTAEAGYGLAAHQEIGVREPSVHWSGTKALFSMVIGGTTQND